MNDGWDFDHVGQRIGSLRKCALYRRTVVATCPACRRQVRFDGVALWWLFDRRGWDGRLRAVPRRLRCDPCFTERRRVVRPTLRLSRDEPTASLPHPPDHIWRQLTGRFRA